MNDFSRYERQMILPGFGEAGQQKLSDISVLVIGAGGLGCPALQYLAGAGIGTIGIVDDDIVSLNNLHRQVLYSSNDIGAKKAIIAQQKLLLLNPSINVHSYTFRLTNHNSLELFREYDIIFDGTDNFATRYMINDACVLLKKPLIFGAINRFEGQVAVFNVLKDEHYSTNYRDLFPEIPLQSEVLNCAEGGVPGMLPSVIGSLMAMEIIKLITGIGGPLVNKILMINLLNYQQQVFNILPAAAYNGPVDEKIFETTDYQFYCTPTNTEIEADELSELLKEKVTLADVRETGESPIVLNGQVIHTPLSSFKQHMNMFTADTVILFCQSGSRSQKAAEILKEFYGDSKKIYSVKNGVTTVLSCIN